MQYKSWGKKQAVALQKSFFDTLPKLPTVKKEKADIAWFLYDIILDKAVKEYNLALIDTVYTEFEPALLKVTTAKPSNISDFVSILQNKLDERLENNPPDAPTLMDIINS